MTALITLVLMVDCVWTVSIVIRVIAPLVTLENTVWLVGRNFDFYLVGTMGVLFWKNLFLSNHEVCFFPI